MRLRTQILAAAESTDPLDIEAFRRNGYALIDWVSDYYARLSSMPVYEPVEPGAVRAQLPARAPEHPEPFEAVLADLDDVVSPALGHWQHPGWLAYFPAASSPAAVLGELAAAGLSVEAMMWSTSPAATEVESHVLDWLVDLLDLPQEWKTTGSGGGVTLSGASSATHTALVVARDQCRKRTGAALEQMVAYASSQAHSSIEKGARVAGYDHIRLLDTGPEFALRPATLAAAIASDRRAGLEPASLCSALGTTGTTGVDPFRSLKLWFVLRSFGAEGLRNMIRSHVDWAQALAADIDSHPSLELMASVPFAMIPFAHRGGNPATEDLIAAINADGRFYVTGSEIDGRRYVRVAVGSIWTTRAHIDALWKLIQANA